MSGKKDFIGNGKAGPLTYEFLKMNMRFIPLNPFIAKTAPFTQFISFVYD